MAAREFIMAKQLGQNAEYTTHCVLSATWAVVFRQVEVNGNVCLPAGVRMGGRQNSLAFGSTRWGRLS